MAAIMVCWVQEKALQTVPFSAPNQAAPVPSLACTCDGWMSLKTMLRALIWCSTTHFFRSASYSQRGGLLIAPDALPAALFATVAEGMSFDAMETWPVLQPPPISLQTARSQNLLAAQMTLKANQAIDQTLNCTKSKHSLMALLP
jgi:hypothetical protein